MNRPTVRIPNARIPFACLLRRLEKASWGRLRPLGRVSGHPILHWRYTPPHPKASLILSAGIHGDEPAGVESLLQLLESRPAFLQSFDLTLFPCLNPWGYEHHVRHNEKGADLNRDWKSPRQAEVLLARQALGNQHADLTICLHEDYDATGFYAYEVTHQGTLVGNEIVRRVSRILPIERRVNIEGLPAIRGVVVRHPRALQRRKRWPEALYHHARHTHHSLTLETPTHFPIQRRIRAHLVAIQTALLLLLP